MLKHALIAAAALAVATAAQASGMGDVSANGPVFSTHTRTPVKRVKPIKPYCDTTSSSRPLQDSERTHADCPRKLPEVPPGATVIPV